MPEAFGLDSLKAKELVQDQLNIFENWQPFFTSQNVPSASLKVIEKIIEPKLNAAKLALEEKK